MASVELPSSQATDTVLALKLTFTSSTPSTLASADRTRGGLELGHVRPVRASSTVGAWLAWESFRSAC